MPLPGLKRLLLVMLLQHINDGLSPNRQSSPESIGRRLRALGFEGKRARDGRFILVNQQVLRTLKLEWGLVSEEDVISPNNRHFRHNRHYRLRNQVTVR